MSILSRLYAENRVGAFLLKREWLEREPEVVKEFFKRFGKVKVYGENSYGVECIGYMEEFPPSGHYAVVPSYQVKMVELDGRKRLEVVV